MRARTNARRRLIAVIAVALMTVAAGCAGPPDDSRAASATGPSAGSMPGRPAPGPTPSSGATAPGPRSATHWITNRVEVGRTLVTSYAGPASKVTMKVYVWLPPQYDDPRYAQTRFPVLELFPGGAGVTYTQWFGFGQPMVIADGAAAGTMTPFILVEPQMQLSYRQDTECTDLPGQPKVGTFFEQDVPDLIKRTFRALPDRTGWGVGGASSGAYCAARLLLHRPDVFSVGGIIDGYFVIDSNLAAGKNAAAKATSPMALAATAPPDVLLRNWYGTYGGDGTVSTKRNNEFAAVVKPPMRFESVVIPGGRHSWKTYQDLMPAFFAFFTQTLAKPSS